MNAHFLPPLSYIVMEVFTIAVKQEEERKRAFHFYKEVKLSLFSNFITLYIENSKDAINKLVVVI
jgi:hypothetical protein